jgi:hypothetical protein
MDPINIRDTNDISMEIVFMSGHYPKTSYYPQITKKINRKIYKYAWI